MKLLYLFEEETKTYEISKEPDNLADYIAEIAEKILKKIALSI